MGLVKLSNLFEICYGDSLELNRLSLDYKGVNFVSRTSTNNGVSAKVKKLDTITPREAGIITVSLGGSVLEAFVQPYPFYTGFHIFCLSPKIHMNLDEKLYYCACIRANKYRYNYGRQANRTLKDLTVPDIDEVRTKVKDVNINTHEEYLHPVVHQNPPAIATNNWEWFTFKELFELKKGKRLTKANMSSGVIPYIGAIDKNNGYRQFISSKPIHSGNTITVNYNGSVGEAFYQPKPYWATDDINVLYPKFPMNAYIGLFLCAIIRAEKYRYNYGRKWHLDRMRESKIKLPINNEGNPDWEFMERYIKTLPFSMAI